jgi:hypothetical protein
MKYKGFAKRLKFSHDKIECRKVKRIGGEKCEVQFIWSWGFIQLDG